MTTPDYCMFFALLVTIVLLYATAKMAVIDNNRLKESTRRWNKKFELEKEKVEFEKQRFEWYKEIESTRIKYNKKTPLDKETPKQGENKEIA